MRIGIGFDVHRLVKGRKLILGGVPIKYELGLEGHSDADVLTHAIIDALLGAAGLRDIGYYFPPENASYKGISSLLLLKETIKLIKAEGYTVGNIDAVVVMERPRLTDYIESIRNELSKVLAVARDRVMVKATTTEGLGYTGRSKGIAAHAVALLVNKEHI